MKAAAALLLCALSLPAALLPVNESTYDSLLRAKRGKVVLVHFWATWCVPCRAELPFLSRLIERLKPRGLEVIAVSADDPEQAAVAEKLLLDLRFATPLYRKAASSDDGFINAIDDQWSGALPASFLYDRGGRRVRSFIGETSPAELERAILRELDLRTTRGGG